MNPATSHHTTPRHLRRYEGRTFTMYSWKKDKNIIESRKSLDRGESEEKFLLSLVSSSCRWCLFYLPRENFTLSWVPVCFSNNPRCLSCLCNGLSKFEATFSKILKRNSELKTAQRGDGGKMQSWRSTWMRTKVCTLSIHANQAKQHKQNCVS